MNISLDKIAPPVAFVVIGSVMIIIGAIGVIPIGNPPPVITEPILKVVLVVLGVFLVLAGPAFVWREMTISKPTSKESLSDEQPRALSRTKYGITIEYPPDGYTEHSNAVEISGSYKCKPPHQSLRLFVVSDDRTRYWPHHIVG